jgi:16S rRNA pseudouridine516 synthase
MRLDRFIESKLSYSAQTVRGLFSQRLVMLNGIAVTDGRGRITEFCRVEVDGELLQARQAIYVMLNKPKGCVSATSDTKNKTVIDLINLPEKNELHLAGRLDFNTTGLLLLTNDGAWSRKITLPQTKIPKTYWVETKGQITPEHVNTFLKGIFFRYENLWTQPAELQVLSDTTAYLTIYEGRYHQIKRMFGFFDNEVVNLHRLSVGSITLDQSLGLGDYKYFVPEN